VEAHEGESLGVALALSGRLMLRRSPVEGAPRGMFCLMGACQECVVQVDGAAVASCIEPVRAGMRVEIDRLARNQRTALRSTEHPF
jgi:aerobic-type carbon monoxide dehydrogenase small subunit (CoxS/CutS family)